MAMTEEMVQAAIRQADALGDDLNEYVVAMLATQHRVADIWTTDYVKSVRDDLTEDQAWEVLCHVADRYDPTETMYNWLFNAAESLFGLPPEDDEEDSCQDE
jgi:hypothetical protein